MKSLTKIMVLTLSLGVFAQDSYASAQVEKEDAGCSCFSFLKCLRKTRQVFEPMAEAALDVAATTTGKTELHNVVNIMHAANQAVDATEVGLGLDKDGALNLMGGVKAAVGGVSSVLTAAGQGDSKAGELFKKFAPAEEKSSH